MLEEMTKKLNDQPDAMTIRSQTVEHPFGTLKLWMGTRHFLMKQLKNVRTEMSLHVLAYNLTRMMKVIGVSELMKVLKNWAAGHLLVLWVSVRRYQLLKLNRCHILVYKWTIKILPRSMCRAI